MPQSIIEEEIKNTNHYMKRIFYFIIISLVVQIIQAFFLLAPDKLLSGIVVILLMAIPTAFIAYTLFKVTKSYDVYLSTHRKINLEEAINNENYFFFIMKICSWLLIAYLVLTMCFVLFLGANAYFNNL